MHRTRLAGLALATLCTLVPGALFAQARPATLRYTTGSPPKTPWMAQLERFQKSVDEESKGALKIDAFPNAQLGNEQDTIQQVARGRIDMGGFSTGAIAIVAPEIQLFGLPFYYKSVAESDCTVDAMRKPITELLARRGLHFLSFTDIGTIDFVGKKPFLVPADARGIKAAAYGSRMMSLMWTTLGANSSQMGITEWASAFQSGAIDATGTSTVYYVPSGLNKLAPVLSRVELYSSPAYVVINKGVYDRLPKDQRDALDRASNREPASAARAEVRAFESAIRGMHEKSGGQVATPTAAQREEWRKALAPAWPQMVKETGGEAEGFFRQIEAARKSCEGRS